MNQANWDDILGKAKEFGKAVGNVAGEVVDASRQKLDEMKKRRELEECYMKLGKRKREKAAGKYGDSYGGMPPLQ